MHIASSQVIVLAIKKYIIYYRICILKLKRATWFRLAVDEHFSPFNWYFATFRTFCLAHSNNFDERVIFSHLVLVHS